MKSSSLLAFILSLFLIVNCSSCHNDNSNSSQFDPPINDDYTLLIYMCGSDLESRLGKGSANIVEMEEATFKDNVNVIVQTGGSKKWVDEEISPNSTDRYLITNGKKELIDRDINKKNFGDKETLKDFIKFGVENYPAKKMSLVLWDHGGGPTKGVCFDANFNNDGLTLLEIEEALKETSSIINKWEFIGFDACLMANYDVAMSLSNYANYMIASEDLEPSSGWDYKTLISELKNDDFYSKVIYSYANKHKDKSAYTLSAINLSEIAKADDLINKISEQINYDISNVSKALFDKTSLGSKKENKSSNLYDLGNIASSLEIEFDSSSFIIKTNGPAHDDISGLSIYFPNEEKALNEYANVCKNKNYLNFLTSYYKDIPTSTIIFSDRGHIVDNKLSFSVSSSSSKYIHSLGYMLHAYSKTDKTNKLYYVGNDNDVDLENGQYSVNFTGNWVYLNDTLIHCSVLEETDSYTVFSSLVKINGELGQLLFSYFKSTKGIQLDGYILDGDITSRINDLQNQDKITILYEDVSQNNYIEEETILWNNDSKLTIKKLDKGTYQYIPYVLDTYGNTYCARTATLYFDGEKVTNIDIAEA